MNKRIINFENVNKKLNNHQILKNVSFEINKSDVVGLIGPNGAGKTTILRLILGSLRSTSGKVEVFGEVNGQEERKNNMKIGFVLEKHGLNTKWTAEENIFYYSYLYNISKAETIDRIEILKSLLGLKLNIKDLVATYSKGMLQQLAILNCLIHKPEILVLDEPTSGLDPNMQAIITRLIAKLSKVYNVTIIVSSHNLKDLENVCNKFILIHKGEMKLFFDKLNYSKNENFRVVFTLNEGSKNDENLFKSLIDKKNILGYSLKKGTLSFEITNQKYAQIIYNSLIENNFVINFMQIKKMDILDMYFEIIGEEKDDKEINIY